DLLQDITLKDLASYLQITPTYLSRIRKEITFGKK
ncbi:Crp/Fnr family transcriptional regulator, partial [Bacteroides muris (ex Afrizal et al. 2022)]